MKFQISKNEITNGTRDNVVKCPTALSIRAKGFKNVIVYANSVSVNDTWYDLPPDVRNFIEKYDKNEKVKPFSFILPITKPNS